MLSESLRCPVDDDHVLGRALGHDPTPDTTRCLRLAGDGAPIFSPLSASQRHVGHAHKDPSIVRNSAELSHAPNCTPLTSSELRAWNADQLTISFTRHCPTGGNFLVT